MMRVEQRARRFPAVKFSVAVEYWDVSKSFDVSVFESGRVVCVGEGEQDPVQLHDQGAALLKAKEVLKEVSGFVQVGGKLTDRVVLTGQKWIVLLEFWGELDRPYGVPHLSFRVYKGGMVKPDPSPLVLPLPGMEKKAEKVLVHDIALAIAQKIIRSACWSIESKNMTKVEKLGGL